MTKQKTYFISHGAPTLIIENIAARDFLLSLGKKIPKPNAILMVSAHWETHVPTLNKVEINQTIHDFYGFPPQLYQMQYNPNGAPELADEIADILSNAGLKVDIDNSRGLDHGAWVPLKLMYPAMDIPVLQLSIQSNLGTGHHYELGRALSNLREKNIIIIASGSFTHNLREIKWQGGEEDEWSIQFSQWFHNNLIEGKTCDLLSYRRLAPFAQKAHPTDEHLLPIYVALGAAGQNAKATRIHQSTTLGNLHMDAYSFE